MKSSIHTPSDTSGLPQTRPDSVRTPCVTIAHTFRLPPDSLPVRTVVKIPFPQTLQKGDSNAARDQFSVGTRRDHIVSSCSIEGI